MKTVEALKPEVRRQYIGGSEAAAVLGLSRWDTPLGVWAQKTGQIEKPKIDSEAAELGIYLEEYVARRFMKKIGRTVHRVNETVFHSVYDFLGANLDRRVVGEDALLECKTASARKSKEWDGDEIPREYIIQCLHYLAVTGKKRAYLAVLIGNQDFKVKIIDRDERVLSDLVAKEVAFWKGFVEPRVMPSSVTSNDEGALSALYPVAKTGECIQLGDETNRIIDNLNALKADKKMLEAEIDRAENEIRAHLKTAEVGVSNLYNVSWKNVITKRLNSKKLKEEQAELYEKYVEATASRRLSITKIKEDFTNG